MFVEIQYRREALKAKPYGYYALNEPKRLLPDDLVWSWTDKKFYRADSPYWKFPPMEDTTDIICAIRRVGNSEYAAEVQAKRSYTIR